MAALGRFLAELPLLIVSPFVIAVTVAALALSDLLWFLFGRRQATRNTPPKTESASVVIPNWNGRDLLEKYLPSVIAAMAGHKENEVIVVDNGSTDGSAEYVERAFPSVRVLRLPRNRGFGGGSNAGFRAARNGIVVLLNSDMRVDAGFLSPLLKEFSDDRVFAVSCQIFFSDPAKLREETGLTQGSWSGGRLRVRHRLDDAIDNAFPCFYGGGGSCAFNRGKFLELGGFDELMRPFYLEDTDLGFMAWKRGWKVLYQPASIVYHEHRGTIGKRFSQAYIDGVVRKNFELFTWKNIHEWKRLAPHFAYAFADGAVSMLFGDSRERASFRGLARAFLQLPQALASRWRARSLAVLSDTEAFRRPLGGYFRDRFERFAAAPEKLSVLFVSPYPICPPTHGGGVFMYQTCMNLAALCHLHLLVLLDFESQREPHAELVSRCASAEFLVRVTGQSQTTFASPLPHSVSEFASAEVEWAIHRMLYLKRGDVLQLEYTPLGQYGGEFRQIATILFEHDIYFQSIGRQLRHMDGLMRRVAATFEYLRALRYELRLLPKMDRVQVCSTENRDYLLSYVRSLDGRIDPHLRAGIDTSRYPFHASGREPNTMLFLGGFRHLPNQEALAWFNRLVLPRILERKPEARLIVIGSDPPPPHSLPNLSPAVELRGFVEDVLEPLRRYAVFICPILSGSGVRVKLLEAFAAGMPVVSTSIGAEGLATKDGEICAIADDPAGFAERVIELLENSGKAEALARRAREQVVALRDMRAITVLLEQSYRAAVERKRRNISFTLK